MIIVIKKLLKIMIFLIFFVFAIVFPLELETRFNSLSITITTDSSPTQMDCSRIRKWIM